MPYRHLIIANGAPASPAPGAVPLVATSQAVPHAALRGLDTLIGSGHRVWSELGLRGQAAFEIPRNSNPNSGVTPIYPDKSTPRVAARAYSIPVTPGHWIGVDVLALPSGPTQRRVTVPLEPDTYVQDGAGGTVRLAVTYTNGDAQTITITVDADLPASGEVYAAESPHPYADMLTREITASPLPLNPSLAELEKWTRGDVLADVVVSYIGAPRIIDLAGVERPHSITVDLAAPAWPSAIYASNGTPYAALPSDYPITQLAALDPGAGVVAIRRALLSHGAELGPFLFGWSSATTAATLAATISYFDGAGDDEYPPWSVTGTTEAHIPTSATAASVNLSGWISSHYAAQVDHGDAFLDGRTAVLPVWVAAYCRSSHASATASFRLESSPFDRVVWSTASATWGWILTPGWIEVGTGAQDYRVHRAWGVSSDAGQSAQARALAVFQQRRARPA